MQALRFGDIQVSRLVEAEGPGFYPGFMLPEHDEAAFAAELGWLQPHWHHAATGRLIMSVHSYVIRTAHHTILVDTCVGNDKSRPSTPPWHNQRTDFLERLTAAGVPPESVDVVLCTHLHVDHVGWNTRLQDGRWVPTFPNARYLFHKDEYAYWEQRQEPEGGSAGSGDGCFADSVLPVMEAGQAVLVGGDHAIDDNLWLEPTPGHSPGHVCLNLQAGGGRAVFSGDLMHHPVQCAWPEWNSRFCHDPAQSRATRQRFVDRHADRDVIVLAAHFAKPTAGRIVGNGGRCRFQA
jgi:glyoxylase-like metal-dependent hydrolase (beta-lactamase superfamily II)